MVYDLNFSLSKHNFHEASNVFINNACVELLWKIVEKWIESVYLWTSIESASNTGTSTYPVVGPWEGEIGATAPLFFKKKRFFGWGVLIFLELSPFIYAYHIPPAPVFRGRIRPWIGDYTILTIAMILYWIHKIAHTEIVNGSIHFQKLICIEQEITYLR